MKPDNPTTNDLDNTNNEKKIEKEEEQENARGRSSTLDQAKMAKRNRNSTINSETDLKRDIPDQPIICYENRLINTNVDPSKV